MCAPPHDVRPGRRTPRDALNAAMVLMGGWVMGHMRSAMLAALGVALGGWAASGAWAQVAHYQVQGDGIEQALNGLPGDAQRGQAIFHDRQLGLCGLCHTVGVAARSALGGDLAGVGSRLSAAQLRLRVVDGQRLNPNSIMPAFHRLPNAARVATAHAGQPLLQAHQVEDVVAYLQTLR